MKAIQNSFSFFVFLLLSGSLFSVKKAEPPKSTSVKSEVSAVEGEASGADQSSLLEKDTKVVKKKKAQKSLWKKVIKYKVVVGGVAIAVVSLCGWAVYSAFGPSQEKVKNGVGVKKSEKDKKSIEDDVVVITDKRAHAAVINGAVGDALGRITEFKATNTQNVRTLSQAFYSKYDCVPYTDDTVMAKIVLEECQKGGSNDEIADRLAVRFRDLLGDDCYQIDPLYLVRAHGGRNSTSAIELGHLSNQKTSGWWKKRYEGNSEAVLISEGGCGSVMRAWPIGLVCDDLEQVIQLADMQSCITHALAMSRAASAAMAVGTMLAHQGKSIDEIVEGMVAAAARYDDLEKKTKTHAQKVVSDADLTADKVRDNRYFTSDMIRYAAKMGRDGKSPAQVLGTNNDGGIGRSPQGFLRGWAADEAVAAAVYLLVRNKDKVNQAIIEGVNTPGDSDSIASLAGVLVGAYSGNVFEDPDLEQLENKKELELLSQKK
jgi:ADP-ribosylglycohydrolase